MKTGYRSGNSTSETGRGSKRSKNDTQKRVGFYAGCTRGSLGCTWYFVEGKVFFFESGSVDEWNHARLRHD